MAKNKVLKYRAVCPECDRPFDSRDGRLIYGHLCCESCARRQKFLTNIDYMNAKFVDRGYHNAKVIKTGKLICVEWSDIAGEYYEKGTGIAYQDDEIELI